MTFDHAQSSRLGQRVGIEQPGVRIIATSLELPEAPYDGQLVFIQDEIRLYIFADDVWVPL